MTGGTWINLLYEVMNEEDLIDSKVDIEKMRELLIIAQNEACFDGDESALGTSQSVVNH
jgi:hypothetical protein